VRAVSRRRSPERDTPEDLDDPAIVTRLVEQRQHLRKLMITERSS
jgi:hypothetical protein